MVLISLCRARAQNALIRNNINKNNDDDDDDDEQGCVCVCLIICTISRVLIRGGINDGGDNGDNDGGPFAPSNAGRFERVIRA